ncbi:hypothetical protein BDP27DRAFT_1323097 [Rhodocollybia butyracea]|uniref:Uncharacterized protein n=1 Tax=Rhodocollybia butyracea TaxID=206335 RepID=A0A9P5PX34_9AGAR|nr:hypothetical protein BDP27DRAFT_1323097 [Rhodocollybia butyracea]
MFSSLSCLDELIQLIYHSTVKFVLLSSVTDDKWVIHLCLADSARWWRGSWDEADVSAFAGSKTSSDELLDIAEALKEAIISEEFILSGWSKESNTKIELTIAPSSDKPARFHLSQIHGDEVASYSTNILTIIASSVVRCQLRVTPSNSDATSLLSPSKSHAVHNASETLGKKREDLKMQKLVEPSKKRQKRESTEAEPVKPPSRPPKGASLANPTKKARKLQVVEFESD